MKSDFIYSLDNKRYHTLNYHILQKFGSRVFKAVIDAGFTCPNIDGTLGFGGCTYCTSGAAEFTNPSDVSVSAQIELEKQRIYKKWGRVPVIAYFQAHTNTYADLSKLKRLYEEALSVQGVVGLSIATRPDCLDDEKISYLKELSQKTYLTVELGLQTAFDETAKKINRGYLFDAFEHTFNKLKQNGIRVCVHLINGLIDETPQMMIQTAKTLGKMKPDAVKIHLLHIMKGTVCQKEYEDLKLIPMTIEDYIKTVCEQLRYLPPECVIERITGDGSKENLIAPRWSTNKIAVLGGIDKFMEENNIYQGDKCHTID
ncbi:MAG: TIGR01212 family radical SAM protein [Clostridia bacterium]|nr:TIGR01212 family radical SAM protein [Clostridia bacterium]